MTKPPPDLLNALHAVIPEEEEEELEASDSSPPAKQKVLGRDTHCELCPGLDGWFGLVQHGTACCSSLVTECMVGDGALANEATWDAPDKKKRGL